MCTTVHVCIRSVPVSAYGYWTMGWSAGVFSSSLPRVWRISLHAWCHLDSNWTLHCVPGERYIQKVYMCKVLKQVKFIFKQKYNVAWLRWCRPWLNAQYSVQNRQKHYKMQYYMYCRRIYRIKQWLYFVTVHVSALHYPPISPWS